MSVASAPLADLGAAARRAGVVSLARRLAQIRTWLASDLSELESALASTASGEDLAHRAASHLLELPGKRVRPLAVMLASRTGVSISSDITRPDAVRDLAVAAELLHAATLLHDDVIDEGTERRGAATARLVFGNSASVLAGDHLLVTALRRVRAAGLDEVLDEFLETIDAMVAAEALQLRLRGTFVPDRDLYMQVIDGKTAALFRWTMLAGGTVAGLPKAQITQLADAGRDLGVAFQLVDDTLDLEGDPRLTGKNALADLREGKLTWPLIVASERDPRLAQRLQNCAQDPGGDHDLTQLRRDALSTGCLDDTKRRATGFADSALQSLGSLPNTAARNALEAVVEACVSRVR